MKQIILVAVLLLLPFAVSAECLTRTISDPASNKGERWGWALAYANADGSATTNGEFSIMIPHDDSFLIMARPVYQAEDSNGNKILGEHTEYLFILVK